MVVDSKIELYYFCNSDWVSCLISRKFITGVWEIFNIMEFKKSKIMFQDLQ